MNVAKENEEVQRNIGGNMYKKCEEILNKLESEGKIKISDYQFPPKQELKLKLKDMLEENVDEKYYLGDEWLKKIKYEYENNTICETRYDEGIRTFKDNICGSLRTIDAGGNKCVIQVKEATKQGYKEVHEGDGVNISSRMKYQRGNVQKESIQTLTTSGSNDREVVVDKLPGAYGRDFGSKGKIQNKEYCDTLTASMGTGGGNVPIFQNNLRIRKLTPKECWRLMGFDDEDFEKASQVNSNTQLYKQAGNSICVPVLMAIFKELIK